jgi:outer membrane protein, multidrug efflux system
VRRVDRALAGNQELRILNESIQIASNEVLARRGAYLPFVTAGGGASVNRPSVYTPEGVVENQLPVLPGVPFPTPLPNYVLGVNLFWQVDIWRQLRNARDAAAQRFLGAAEERNYFVTRLVAEIADNYYGLIALDARLENLDRIIELQEQSLEITKARRKQPAAPSCLSSVSRPRFARTRAKS